MQGSPLGNPGQQRKRRREGEDGESDSEGGGSGKRLHGEGGVGGQARGDGVTNDELMSVLRSIKDSISGIASLNTLRQLAANSSAGGSLHAIAQGAQAAQDGNAGLTAQLSAQEEQLGSLLKLVSGLPGGDMPGEKQPEDNRIGVLGQMTADDSNWDQLETDAIEEVFKDMWNAMHPTIQLAEGQEEPTVTTADGQKKTSKRPLTLQAKKKYIRRNVKVAIDGVKSKLAVRASAPRSRARVCCSCVAPARQRAIGSSCLASAMRIQVLACCPWVTFLFGHCDVSSPMTTPFLKAGQLMWSRNNLSEEVTARCPPCLTLAELTESSSTACFAGRGHPGADLMPASSTRMCA